jgi:hypothetical protein
MTEPGQAFVAEPVAPSDAAVIGQSVADPERFAEIFDRHADGIYRYAARRLGQQAAADVGGARIRPSGAVVAVSKPDRSLGCWVLGRGTGVMA